MINWQMGVKGIKENDLEVTLPGGLAPNQPTSKFLLGFPPLTAHFSCGP